MSTDRRPPWLVIGMLLLGLAIVYGAVSIYRDQHSGTPGRAEVSGCAGGTKYDRGIRCDGSWSYRGHVVLGRVEGAGYGDVDKTIDVRIHGGDHATVPSLATPIVLLALGGGLSLLCLWGIASWARGPRRA
jgi:hypothetical protein